MVFRRSALLMALAWPGIALAQQRGATKPPPLLEKMAAPPVPPKTATVLPGGDRRTGLTIGEAAPVPNRSLDRPVIAPIDGPTLEPSIIQRKLPGRGQAAEGAPSRTEERLFDPAPGARLTLPFTY